MKNRNVKVIDEHNIDRNANVMFAVDLNGSEYVVYWIERDEESNNVFVSKVLKNLDGTYNMLNIDDADKKKEVSEVVKYLVSSAVTDQSDKLVGVTKTLSNGEVAKFISVSFNKEQNINVPKTYITTVKKEVTKIAEDYYDVVSNEAEIENVLTPVNNVPPQVVSAPEVVETITNVETPVVAEVQPEPVVVVTPTVETPVAAAQVTQTVATPEVTSVVSAPVEPVLVQPEPVVVAPVVETPVAVAQVTQTVATPEVTPVVSAPVEPVLVQPEPVVVAPVVETPVVPTPVVTEPIVNTTPVAEQPLVFNAAKETNLNAALGEVANSNNVPVQNINVVREFGEEAPVAQTVTQPAIAPMVQPTTSAEPKMLVKKAGFANSKFFMVVAIAFFMASCVFLGYEVFNYFQLTGK